MLFLLDNLQVFQKSVSLHCVFHSIRFKVNKGWSKALLLFLCPYPNILSTEGSIKTVSDPPQNRISELSTLNKSHYFLKTCYKTY